MDDIKEEIKSRILEPFSKAIECEDGWLPLLEELHNNLVKIDPNYRVYQVKEKFGALCFYYAISNPELYNQVRDLVQSYERRSLKICEKTGGPGSRRIKHGVYKTLSDEYEAEGWKRA
jgi:hypothetical protein